MKYKIEQRAGIHVLIELVGLRPATDAEVYLWEQLAEARGLLSKVAADKKWADAHEWQDAVNALLAALAGGSE